MQRKFRIIGAGALLLLVVGLAIVDTRIKADNARQAKLAQDMALGTAQQIEWSLAKVRAASSRNAAATVSVIALQKEYEKAEQSYAGMQAFKGAFARYKPRIVAPLIEPYRSGTGLHLFTLGSSIDRHAQSLMAKESIEENASGGLITAVQRTFGSTPS